MIGTNELDAFVLALTVAKAAHMKANFPSLKPETYSYSMGKKFAKVVSERSVFCFVDLANGDILKAAGYNAPAKNGSRGNIANGAADVTPYGAAYKNFNYPTYRSMGIA